MFWHILARDLKRKKTMNVILLLFIILASIFMSSSLNNIVSVVNGIDYYMEQAGVGDYIIITMGSDIVGTLDDVVDKDYIDSYSREEAIMTSQNAFELNGGELTTNSTNLIEAVPDGFNYFDADNNVITQVNPGEIMVCSRCAADNNLKIGDIIRITIDSVDREFTYAGSFKDALLGSSMMANSRFLISDEDYNAFLQDETIFHERRGEVFNLFTDDVKAIQTDLKDKTGLAFNQDNRIIKMTYMMELIVAAVILIMSICLVVVSFIVLKYAINFTISEEFREIGVMKAIGIPNISIRSLYFVKYFGMAIVGSVIGFFLGIPFGDMLLKFVSVNLVLGNTTGVLLNVIGSVAVVVAIILYAFGCTKIVKKSSPVDAIREGNSGERYKNKSAIRLAKTGFRPTAFMAVNDILSSPKRYLSIIITFMISCLLAMVLANTAATMKSDSMIDLFGVKRSDAYYDDTALVMECMHEGKEGYINALNEMTEELTDAGMPCTMCVDVWYLYPMTFNGEDYTYVFQQGINVTVDDYKFDGDGIKNVDEVAVSHVVADQLGVSIGDVITVYFDDGPREFIVVDYYYSMNNLGQVIRFHQDVPTEDSHLSSSFQFQIDFTDNPSKAEVADRIERIKELYNNENVLTAAEFCADSIGVADTIETVEFFLVLITILVVIFVAVLMERSFISNEKGQIAMLKAIGFSDGSIITWHLVRFVVLAAVSVILAEILSMPVTSLTISPIFQSMGAGKIDYVINPLKAFVIYPGIILGVTAVTAFITSLYSKTIKANDASSIE